MTFLEIPARLNRRIANLEYPMSKVAIDILRFLVRPARHRPPEADSSEAGGYSILKITLQLAAGNLPRKEF